MRSTRNTEQNHWKNDPEIKKTKTRKETKSPGPQATSLTLLPSRLTNRAI